MATGTLLCTNVATEGCFFSLLMPSETGTALFSREESLRVPLVALTRKLSTARFAKKNETAFVREGR